MTSLSWRWIGAVGGVPSVFGEGAFASFDVSVEVCFSFIASQCRATELILDARIHEGVGDVNQEIENQNRDRDEGDDPDNQRLVAIQVGVDKVIAQSRQGVDALDNDGASNEERERRAAKGNNRQQSATQGMTHNHLRLRQALRARSPDVVGA